MIRVNSKSYIVATIRPWNIKIYNDVISHYPGMWYLVRRPEQLNVSLIKEISPRYIFFPHWSDFVHPEILNLTECVCFHETDLPFGRGGSPIQNLIASGHRETVVSALRMIGKLDAGPIYLKRPLSLEGLAEEIFIRTSKTVADMILEIIKKEPTPKEQKGESTVFHRRTPEQSEISRHIDTLDDLFTHIRMLDSAEYPKAFLKYGRFRFEISRPALRYESIEGEVHITIDDDGEEDV